MENYVPIYLYSSKIQWADRFADISKMIGYTFSNIFTRFFSFFNSVSKISSLRITKSMGGTDAIKLLAQLRRAPAKDQLDVLR